MIEPGETFCCFIIESNCGTVEGKFDATGYTPIPRATDGEEIEAQIERDYGKGHNVFGDIYLGDTRVPGPELSTQITVVPRILNINFTTEGTFIVKVYAPPGYSVKDIDGSSLIFQGWKVKEWRNYQNKYLIAKFPKDGPALSPGNGVRVYLWGRLKDGRYFRGSDTITIIDEPVEVKKKKPKPKEPIRLELPLKRKW